MEANIKKGDLRFMIRVGHTGALVGLSADTLDALRRLLNDPGELGTHLGVTTTDGAGLTVALEFDYLGSVSAKVDREEDARAARAAKRRATLAAKKGAPA